MPVDLLELRSGAALLLVDALEGLDKQEAVLEQRRRAILPKLAPALEELKGMARAGEETWRQIVLDVAKGHTAAMQKLRPEVLSALQMSISACKQAYGYAVRLRKSYGEEVIPDPDFLLLEIADLERLKVGVFDRWETADDLEDLAARDYPLTTADLDQIGPNRRPPALWYTKDGGSAQMRSPISTGIHSLRVITP